MPQSILSSLASRSMAARALAFLGALAVCGSVQAGTVDVTYQGGTVWNGNGFVGGLAISYPKAPATTLSEEVANAIYYYADGTRATEIPEQEAKSGIAAGAFALTASSGPLGNFIAFCVDVRHYLGTPPGQYENPGDITSVGFYKDRIFAVQALFNTAYAGVLDSITDNALVGGFQLALWEILYEPYHLANEDPYAPVDGAWDLARGGFSVTGASDDAMTAAANMLDNLNGVETGSYALTFLKSTPPEGGEYSQNLVTAVAIPAPVPLPAASLLLLAGLVSLGAASRRRKAA